ncbi:MAG: glycine--tRNA ligase subunit beta [Candidatus Aminicenantales bacterium]
MEFLLEINTEEMPSSHVKIALEEMKERFGRDLASSGIAVKELRTLGTSRRLVVVGDIASRQEDREELLTGPPKSAAFAPDGSPTPAAHGFARAQGVDIGQLEILKTNRGEYVGIKKIQKGKETPEILARIIPLMISSLSFPKMMRWREGSFKFSRPIRNILCVCGEKTLSFSFEGLKARNSTTGHKIHAPQRLIVRTFKGYKAALKKKKVIIEDEERRKMILSQAEERLSSLKAQLLPDQELLEKLSCDVEYPHVFLGSFSEKYLNLPLEVLSTALREGQKLFSVVRGKKQLPYFLGIADNPADEKALIRKGNERVLKARLEDARFFWEQDLKLNLRQRASGLKQILFQEKLGSYEDKCQRLKKIIAYLCDKAGVPKIKKEAVQAAELCKADLLTEMVREFPSLQGKMGGLYAREEGLPSLVAQAIYEHYQPGSLDAESPSSMAGALLSIADKMDSIVGVVGIGIQTTGSSDPFGLRRNAQGICKIILDKKLIFSLARLLDKVLLVYGDKIKKPADEVIAYCQDFFLNRLRYIYEKQGYRYDLVHAALGAGIDNIYFSQLRLKALDSLKSSPQFEPMILMAKRTNNIISGQSFYSINTGLFQEKEEKELYSTFSIIKQNVVPMFAKGDFSQAQKIIFRIQPSLNGFFDHVLVMAKETRLRKNRLALLQAIGKIMIQIADYSQAVVGGEKLPKGKT